MKRYKYQTLVTLVTGDDGGALPTLPGPTCRMVIRAYHRETHIPKMFSALVTSDQDSPVARTGSVTATVTVLGDDAGDYLAPGERFALWRGHDLGSGVVTRRIFV
jgi:hypothetical protein